MDPIVSTAAIGVGSNLVNNMFQQIGNRRQNKRMVDFWRMNNAYNHPSEQMARLRQAGLNPHLIYGQSAAGATGVSSSPPTPVPQEPFSIGDPAGIIMNARRMKLQDDNLRAQNNVLQSQYDKNVADTAGKLINNKWLDQQQKEKLRVLATRATYQMLQNNHAWQQWHLDRIEPQEFDQRRKLHQASIIEKYTKGSADLTNAQKLARLRELEVELKENNVNFMEANSILNIISQIMGVYSKF